MKHLLIILAVYWLKLNAAGQEVTFYVTGDRVHVRRDTTFTASPVYQEEWGTKFTGRKISASWYSFVNEGLGGNEMFISTKYAAETREFKELAEKKKEKNVRTKYELMLIYLAEKDSGRAEQVSLDLIKNQPRENVSLGFEHLTLVGPLAMNTMLGDRQREVFVRNYCEQIISQSKDSMMIVLAMLRQAEYYLLNEQRDNAEKRLFEALTGYSGHLFIPFPADGDYEAKIAPEEDLKSMFVSLHSGYNSTKAADLAARLKKILEETHDAKVKSVISDIYKKLKSQ